MSVDIEIAGEQLTLRPDHTAFWPRHHILMLADPHFGKAATFRASGIPVPGNCQDSLHRLSFAIESTKAKRLIILGDFWHDRDGCTESIIDELNLWRMNYREVEIQLIHGNHDRVAPPSNWASKWLLQPVVISPFVFSHHPDPSKMGFVFAGHLHPSVSLRGLGRQRLRLPCFWITKTVGVLPAFGDFTGTAPIQPELGDRVFAVAEECVIEVSGRFDELNRPDK